MNYSARSLFTCCCVAFHAAVAGVAALPAAAVETQQPEQAVQARPYLLGGSERRLLESLRRFVAAEQWEEALDVALRLQDSESDGLVARDVVARDVVAHDEVYVGLRATIHQTIARMPPTAMARYRGLVDPTAEAWYRDGIGDRDIVRLQRVIDQSFCSSWGDDALLALGELALEQGDYSLARYYWMQLHPSLAGERLAYPDSDVSLSDIHARLALVSIREGDWSRAVRELEQLKANHPDARGRLGGRDVLFVDHLASLLRQARQRPPLDRNTNWPTFAGNSARTAASNAPIRPNFQRQWSQPLGTTTSNTRPLVYPIVADNQIIYQHGGAIHAVELATGRQLFVSRGEKLSSGVAPTGSLGQQTSTLTSQGQRVFGTTTTFFGTRRSERRTDSTHGLWGIDLERDGARDFRVEPDEASATYVGAPVADGSRLLVAMRSGGRTARVGIACYDLGVGRLSWRRWLCQANSSGAVLAKEPSHDLLTLDAGIVYTCPDLGVIAALRARDGKLLWLRSYERFAGPAKSDGDSPFVRAPNPAIYARGGLYVSPADSREVLALDAATGRVRWRRAISDSASRMVGLVAGRLVQFDRGIELLAANTGDVLATNNKLPLVGTPAVYGETIFWPTKEAIYSIDVATAQSTEPALPLPESGGANLAIAGEFLIAAGPTQVTVFRAMPFPDQVSQLP